MSVTNNLSVSFNDSICKPDALKFAEFHQLNCIAASRAEKSTGLSLNFTAHYIELCDWQTNSRIHVDFLSGATAHRQHYGGGKGQAIAKAIGLKTATSLPTVLDATAGLAKDAYVMACLGCPIILLEQSPIVAKLVADGIERACHDDFFQQILTTGFTLIQQNSIQYLTTLTNLPDVIYLDPMYPDRKKSALVKKNMQILQKLLSSDKDGVQLFEVALLHAKNRVVVKRPKGAEAISARVPDTTIESKKTRYDIYFTFKNNT